MRIKEFARSGDRRIFGLAWNFIESDTAVFPERRKDLPENPFYLDVFHINDIHGNIYMFDYSYTPVPVFSRIVRKVKEARTVSESDPRRGVLFVSAGDDSIGSPLDHLAGYDGRDFILHPAYLAYSLAGMDATVLGNHDFDAGLATIRKAIENNTDFPVLSANLDHGGELEDLVFPGAVVVIKGIRIGLIGVTTPGQIRSRNGSFFSIGDPVAAVRDFYKKLYPYCDSIIVLSHLGYGLGSTFASVESAGDREMASGLEDADIDLIIGGHTHDFLNINGLENGNVIGKIPIVQAGYNGIFYGENSLRISDRNSLVKSGIFPTGAMQSDSSFDSDYNTVTAPAVVSELLKSAGDVDLSEEYISDPASVRGRSGGENPFANYIADALAFSVRNKGLEIDFAAIDDTSMVVYPDLSGKKVSVIDMYRLMPYADTIGILKVSGELLCEILRSNILRMNNPGYPYTEKGFLYFSREIRYEVDRMSGRLVAAVVNGESLDNYSDNEFLVAVPGYIQGLAKSWEKSLLENGKKVRGFREIEKDDTGLYVKEEILSYLSRYGISENSGFCIDERIKVS